MRMRSIILLTVPLFVLFLVVRMPLSVVYQQFLAERLAPGVQIATMTGTVWNGRAQGIRVDGHSLGDLGWSLQRLAIVAPAVHFAFDARGDLSRMTGRLSVAALDGGFALLNVTGTLDARMLEFVMRRTPAKVAGAFELDLARLEIAPDRPYIGSADGAVIWSGAAVLEPINVDLGRVELQMSPIQGTRGVLARFRNSDGAIATDGSFRLDGEGQYELDLMARPDPQAAEQLGAILQLGKRNPDGSSQFLFTGSL